MNKDHILSEIKRIATEEGKPPGRNRFEQLTGITNWYGKYWARWGDALAEAGYEPNKLQEALPEQEVVDKFIKLAIRLGHVPTEGELRLERNRDSDFPSHSVFLSRLGKRRKRLEKAINRAKETNLDDESVKIFEVALANEPYIKEKESNGEVITGFVYLMKSGRYFKIGKTNSIDRRQYEIGLQMPEGIQPIHAIETDDPSGIEAYWHNRFKEKRLKGEWFDLSPTEIRIFIRRKFM